MTGPTPDLDASIAPEGLPADFISLWSTAAATLTERELSAVVLRFGFSTGKPASFHAIGRELGVNRVRAHAIFRNAIQRLGGQDETRALARYLADLNAVLSDEGPVERSRQPVPPIEDIDGEASEGDAGDDMPEPVRHAPVSDEASANVAAQNEDADRVGSADYDDTVDQHESADREEVAADEPVSDDEIFRLVYVADRELAFAAERCAEDGREALAAELRRAQLSITAGMRATGVRVVDPAKTARRAAAASTPASTTGKRRGRPENVEQTARRAAVLARVQAGEISNADAAAELGLTYGAWSAWKSINGKRNGALATVPKVRTSVAPLPIPAGERGRGRSSDPVETARRAAVLERVHAGELSNVQAAKELGISYAAWSGWRANHGKRNGGIASAPTVRAMRTRNESIVPAPAVRAARTPEVGDLVARIERIDRSGAELRRRVRDLVAFVEERGPR